MASSPAFREHVLGKLLPVGPVRARAMFGGYGLYLDGVMFALIAADTLYMKVDDGNRDLFTAAGGTPFAYRREDRVIKMSYLRVPAAVLDDPERLVEWAGLAHEAARRAQAGRRKRRT